MRTQSFKDWFGDWENDPNNSSKVVDENGEPRVCYHGTRSGVFTVFDTDGKGKTHDIGAFFAESVRNAGTYSGSGRFGTFCRANADALCTVYPTFITTFGMIENKYANEMLNKLKLSDLYAF